MESSIRRCALITAWLAVGFGLAMSAFGQDAAGSGVASPEQLFQNLKSKTFTGRKIDLVLTDVGLQTVIAEIERTAGFKFDIDPRIDDRVSYRIRNLPWDEALASVLADNALKIDLNMAGDGFKIHRGMKYVLAFDKSGKMKFFIFLYDHLFEIASAVLILAAALIGWRLFRRRSAGRRKAAKKPLLSESEIAETRKRLQTLMDVDKVYRREDLSLQSLAEALGVTPHQLSWVVNDVLGLSFSDFVNGRRVEEVKGRLSDPSFNSTSILQAAFDAGFNTKAAFNRAFKKKTGLTPSEYKKSNHS